MLHRVPHLSCCLSIHIQVAATLSASLSRIHASGWPGSGSGQHEWAVMGTVPQLEEAWAALKPNLALQYPFQLDVFQKEAIVHMEV